MQRLLELAEQVARLPAYDHRNPHAFHEGKSEVAAALRKLARQLGPAREPRSGVEIRAIHASDNRPSREAKTLNYRPGFGSRST